MDTLNKQKISVSLKEQLQQFFGISLGIFLFILFFQPFGNLRPDVDEKLLFYAGLGGISFLFTWLFRIVLPWFFPEIKGAVKWNISSDIMIYTLIWIFNSLAFVFYIRYVGPEKMSMFLVFKITLVSLAPVIALKIKDEKISLKNLSQALMEKNNKLHMLITETYENIKSVEVFTSENKSEIIKIDIDELILIKSADNYVEIFYRDNNKLHQKLIRNTLKNIEVQLKKYPAFIRCHRTYIINKKYVRDFKKNYTGYFLKLSEFNDDIPVSRQYVIPVKEAITTT